MTIAEQLEAKGFQKGRQEGILKGEKKGFFQDCSTHAEQWYSTRCCKAIYRAIRCDTDLNELSY